MLILSRPEIAWLYLGEPYSTPERLQIILLNTYEVEMKMKILQ
jgi:hypothetical protein